MNAETIKQCKENPLPFKDCLPEMQEYFKAAGEENCQFYNRCERVWQDMLENDDFYATVIYQLKADYRPPQEQVERCEVRLDSLGLLIFEYGEDEKGLIVALDYPNLIGFEYESGEIFDKPRIIRNVNANQPALTPKHVLFKKEKYAK